MRCWLCVCLFVCCYCVKRITLTTQFSMSIALGTGTNELKFKQPCLREECSLGLIVYPSILFEFNMCSYIKFGMITHVGDSTACRQSFRIWDGQCRWNFKLNNSVKF